MTVRNIASICNMVSALRLRGGIDPRATSVPRPAARAPGAAAPCSSAPVFHPCIVTLAGSAMLQCVLGCQRWLTGEGSRAASLTACSGCIRLFGSSRRGRVHAKARIASAAPCRSLYTVPSVPSNKRPSGSASESRFIMIEISLDQTQISVHINNSNNGSIFVIASVK